MSVLGKESVVSVRNKVLTFYTRYYNVNNRVINKSNLIQYKNENKSLSTSGLCSKSNFSDCSSISDNNMLSKSEKTKQAPYNGYMSTATKRKIKNYIEVWSEAVQSVRDHPDWKSRHDKLPYFTFVTLTLASKQFHDDNFIKRNILGRFINESRKEGMFNHYFWRAEPQKNGNIHFHLIIDKYVDYRKLRKKWNNTQGRYGYIERYRLRQERKFANGFFVDKNTKDYDIQARKKKVCPKSQLKRYKTGISERWSNPNSTDIKSIKKIRDLTSYLLKYMCKNGKDEEKNIKNIRKIEGRIYGKSSGLEKLKPYSCSEFDSSFVNWVSHCLNTGVVEKELDIVGNGSVYVLLGNFRAALKTSPFYSKIKRYYEQVIRDLYDDKLTCVLYPPSQLS